MPQYIFQMRRGIKDRSSGRDDWATYERQANHIKPQGGELVLEYDNGVPRLKIGNGVDEFSSLPYMSVDSFILPTKASIVLAADKWQNILADNGEVVANRYYQDIIVDHVTATSRIDLQPSPEQLLVFHQKDITFTAINNGGQVRVCLVGQQPQNDYTIQAMVTEVVASGAIIGNTTTTPYDMQSLIARIEELEKKLESK